MDKRYLRAVLLVGLASLIASQFFARPDLRAFFSPDYWGSMLRYSRVLRLIESDYVHADEVDFAEMTDVALKRVASSLDRYSGYLTPEDYDEYVMDSNQEYVGVGIEISFFADQVVVSNVFAQGAAAESGLLLGDVIIGIDEIEIDDENLREIVNQIRGESGSTLTLRVMRPVSGEELTLKLVRREIALDSIVKVSMLSEEVGYFGVRQFIDNSAKDMKHAIQDLESRGMKALILDLRGNPGGRLDVAASMAEVFLREGETILTVQSRRGDEDVISAGAADFRFEGPMAVLIDEASASASEIFGGALRDHGRAVLVGRQSFGKGSVQSVFEFPGGDGLTLTSARYLLPDGEAIHGVGVRPDVEVLEDKLDSYVDFLQEHHLRNIEEVEFKQRYGFYPVIDKDQEMALSLISMAL